MKKVLILILFVSAAIFQYAQEKYPYQDAAAPVEKRVEDLLNRMTLDEKIDLIGGTGIATKENKRLGIPEMKMTDGPAGARFDKSTAFPVGIATAATWNPELIYTVGQAIGRETKGHGRNIILGPCINIARLPVGGRTFEGMGEDPFLTSRIAVAYIKGVQNEGVAATVKHFAANNEEIDRDYVDVFVSRRALNEIYFPAFKAAVTEAGSQCIMSSYNRVNGRYASENDYLLREVLRNKWNYKGMIMSDWWAVHSAIPTALGALDIEMPNGDYMNIKNLKSSVESGVIPAATIDEKVKNILTLMFKLGIFDKATVEDKSLLNTSENRNVAYKTALESIVLLRNEGNILPLKADKVKTIAVIGPDADTARTGGGGSSEVNPIAPVYSILDGLKSKLPANIKIIFSRGVEFDDNIKLETIGSKYLFTDKSCSKNGLNAEFFNNMNLTGVPVLKRIDPVIDFNWVDNGPGPEVAKDHYSVSWTGYLKVQKTDEYTLGTISDDGSRLWIDDKPVIDVWFPHGPLKRTVSMKLEKGKLYKIRFDLFEKAGGAVATLGWQTGGREMIAKAVEAAKKADYVLLTVGTTSIIETEGRDRSSMALPASQDELIEKVAAVNKNTVVVLTSGSPVLMDRWINKVKGVVETWFAGTEGGNAIADVLLGNYNPSGKLPITFPHKWEDCSAYPTYNVLKERTYYSDDIYVGYRHFDKFNIEPLFPFGYGLSYTTFEYSGLNVTPLDSSIFNVTFNIKNTGSVKGEEAAQVYVSSHGLNVERAVKELKGFAKVALNPGETKAITIKLNKDSFAYFSEKEDKWKVDAGSYKIAVGTSSRDMKLQSDIEVK
ncbi:MAG: glycoside hydrolase family 3 C-terminal domain-containing protein [Ignavibacteriaceae bacterium]|nr:glycoside hydrolase family 3 C-terminal domain-containing protein [Ignavibacteriaceae bacterium]